MAKSLNHILSQNENLGVLSVTTGQLRLAKIPVVDAPDWIIPESLILAVVPYTERIWTYLWQPSVSQTENPDALPVKSSYQQEVAVYHLVPKTEQPTHLVVVESITDVHRLALQIRGEVSYHAVRIADLKDADEAEYQAALIAMGKHAPTPTQPANKTAIGGYQPQFTQQDYTLQPVIYQGELCVVPDLDKLSHFLVDLDS